MKISIEDTISDVLRIGTLLSAILVAFGLVLLFINNGGGFSISSLESPSSNVNSLTFSISDMINGLSKFNGISFIFIGVIVLIATPIMRVIMSILYFIKQKDRLYVAITTIVLLGILVALFIVPHYAQLPHNLP